MGRLHAGALFGSGSQALDQLLDVPQVLLQPLLVTLQPLEPLLAVREPTATEPTKPARVVTARVMAVSTHPCSPPLACRSSFEGYSAHPRTSRPNRRRNPSSRSVRSSNNCLITTVISW